MKEAKQLLVAPLLIIIHFANFVPLSPGSLMQYIALNVITIDFSYHKSWYHQTQTFYLFPWSTEEELFWRRSSQNSPMSWTGRGKVWKKRRSGAVPTFFDMELAEKVTDPVNRVKICVLKNKIRGFTFEVRNIQKNIHYLTSFWKLKNTCLHPNIYISWEIQEPSLLRNLILVWGEI